MRKRECKEVFFLFADMFLSHVVGVAFWRKNSGEMPISEMATVSNKAFALLLLENLLGHMVHNKLGSVSKRSYV